MTACIEKRSDWTSEMFVDAIYRDLSRSEAMIPLRGVVVVWSRSPLAALMIAPRCPSPPGTRPRRGERQRA